MQILNKYLNSRAAQLVQEKKLILELQAKPYCVEGSLAYELRRLSIAWIDLKLTIMVTLFGGKND